MNRMSNQNSKRPSKAVNKNINSAVYDNIPWLQEWKDQLKQEVFDPVQLRETISNRGQPQRCITHNIALSVYCTLCRKVLCASCMYSSMAHRKHRVTPIESAKDEIKEDIRSFEEKMQKTESQIEGLITSNGHLVAQIDKKTSVVLKSLKEFYDQLKRYLKDKEEEQMSTIRQFQEKSKGEMLAYNKQLNNLRTYISQKCRFYLVQSNKSENIASSRSILEVIVHSSKLISDSLMDAQNYTFPTDRERIKRIEGQVEKMVQQIIVPSISKPVNISIARSSIVHRSLSKSVGLRDTSRRKAEVGKSNQNTSMRLLHSRRQGI